MMRIVALTTLALEISLCTSCTTLRADIAKGEVVTKNTKPISGTLPMYPAGNLSLTALRGKVVILSFFTTGCFECQALVERFSRVQAAFGKHRVAVVMVAYNPQLEILSPFLAAMNLPFPVVIGHKKQLEEIQLGWITTVPTTIILDTQGRPRYANVRLGSTRVFADQVKQILKSR